MHAAVPFDSPSLLEYSPPGQLVRVRVRVRVRVKVGVRLTLSLTPTLTNRDGAVAPSSQNEPAGHVVQFS